MDPVGVAKGKVPSTQRREPPQPKRAANLGFRDRLAAERRLQRPTEREGVPHYLDGGRPCPPSTARLGEPTEPPLSLQLQSLVARGHTTAVEGPTQGASAAAEVAALTERMRGQLRIGRVGSAAAASLQLTVCGAAMHVQLEAEASEIVVTIGSAAEGGLARAFQERVRQELAARHVPSDVRLAEQ